MKVSILGVQVENFRTLQNANIELAPITILTGANGAGKSSILKIFRLLQESYQKYELKKLAIESLDMGDWESVVLDKSKNIEIMLSIKAETDEGLTSYQDNHFIALVKEIFFYPEEKEIKFPDHKLAKGYFELVGGMTVLLEYSQEGLERFCLFHEKAKEGAYGLDDEKGNIQSELFYFIKNYEYKTGKGNLYKTNLRAFLPDLQTFEAIRKANIINREASSWAGLPLSEDQKERLIHLLEKELMTEFSLYNDFYGENPMTGDYTWHNEPIDFLFFKGGYESEKIKTHSYPEVISSFIERCFEEKDKKGFGDLSKIKKEFVKERLGVRFEETPAKVDWILDDIINEELLFWCEQGFAQMLKRLMEKTFENIFDHLGALRGNHKRIYSGVHDEGTPMNDILKGYIPVQTEIERIEKEYSQRQTWIEESKKELSKIDLEEDKRKLEQKQLNYRLAANYELDKAAIFYRFLKHYAQKMGFAKDIRVENIENYAYRVKLMQENRKINLADTGYGFVQFVPLLLKLLTLYHKKTRYYKHSSLPLEEEYKKEYKISIGDRNRKSMMKRIPSSSAMGSSFNERDYGFDETYDDFWYDAVEQKKVGKWCYFEAERDISGEPTSNFYVSEILREETEESHEIPNSGHWFSIEEPESNLHPRLQSLLADFFMDLCKTFEVRVIIETHSEYLIRKLQELVADNKIGKDDALIYYFRNPEIAKLNGKEQIDKITFNKDGEIEYWKFDSGFYDMHESELAFGLLNLQRKKFFEALHKDIMHETNPEKRMKMLEERITHYTDIQDLSKFKNDLIKDLTFNGVDKFSILNPKVQHYLASARFFMSIIDRRKKTNADNNFIDFAPVMVEYGKSVETELLDVFKLAYPTKYANREITPDYMQKKLENEDGDSNIITHFSNKLNNFNGFKTSIRGNPPISRSLSPIGGGTNPASWLGIIRNYRNSSGHENNEDINGIWNYDNSQKYAEYVEQFFNLWCSHLK